MGHLRLTCAILVAALVLAPGLVSGAEPAEAGFYERLARGETVTFEQTIDNDRRRYVGGVTYTIVDATVSDLTALLEDVHSYQQVLPRTKAARLLGVNGADFWVELRQGNDLMETSYTIRVRQEPGDMRGRTFRFWLDTTKPHGIADAWGFFRVEPLRDGTQRTLLTYGALVDLGPGIVRELFEERLRKMMLSVPQRVRAYAARVFHGHSKA